MKEYNPSEERIFEARWMLVFSMSQLLRDSIGCFMLEMADE